MRIRQSDNRKVWGWLLSLALLLMTLPTQASWQCPDGHPCPPGCTMQHMGERAKTNSSESLHSCCVPKEHANAATAHCALCSTASSTNAQIREGCTSPVCVLRIQAKPDIATQAHITFVFDTTAILIPVIDSVLVPEETGSVSFGSSRAPPGRAVVSLHSPRAPPVLL